MLKMLTFSLFCLLSTSVAAQPLPVVTSFSILADITQQIGGDAVSVTTLVQADEDAHNFEPTPDHIKTVATAKLFITNGLGFDDWATRIKKSSKTTAQHVVASENVELLSHNDIPDPHAWQDVQNARIYAKNIAAALAKKLPAESAHINTRAAAYDAALVKLDQELREKFSAIPGNHRKIITSHDAFAYLGRAYGIAFLAPEGLSTEGEPSAATIAALSRQIKSEGISTVFLENMSNPTLLNQMARDTGASIGGTLYADALSKPNGPAATYIAMMRHNTTLLLEALQKRTLALSTISAIQPAWTTQFIN